jgi:protein gp37
MASHIQWTDETWNPTTGCTKISPGCAHCYIETTPPFRMAGRKFVKGHIPLRLHADRLDKPLHWRKPRRVFVNSLSDLFHEDVPDYFIEQVFMVMALAYRHTFQVLTKRAERMAAFVSAAEEKIRSRAFTFGLDNDGYDNMHFFHWPLPNIWLGVSAEDQQRADERIPWLLKTPAAVRFLSCEPLIGPIFLPTVHSFTPEGDEIVKRLPKVDWIIVGGESGRGARPCEINWIRSIVRQCDAAGVACFVKQVGAFPRFDRDEAVNFVRHKKGGDPAEWPEDLRVRQFPEDFHAAADSV